MLPVALSVQYAFMLPIATPPNTVAFSTGRLKVIDMVRHFSTFMSHPKPRWINDEQLEYMVTTQNSENDLFNPNITFYISLNKYIKLINSFRLGTHLLRQDLVAGTDVTL